MKKLLAAVVVMGLAFIACQKEYSIETGQNANLTGAWEFKDSTTVLQAGNSVDYYIDDSSNPAQALMVYTGATANLSASISIEVLFPTGTAAIGSYQSANGEVTFSYNFSNSGRLYQVNGSSGQFSTENITVNITQISDSTVTGTFSGTALDSANRLVPIREGKFNYRRRSVVTPPVVVSVGTLGSAVDTCTGAVLAGTYRKNTALTGANTVTLTVNVTTAGSYNISSDTLRGISFGGTGTFAATGVQTVTLPGVGTPTDTAAALRFRVRYGTSNCAFLVKIDTGSGVIIVPPTGDTSYLPTTTNSNWGYDEYDGVGDYQDSMFRRSTGGIRNIGSNAFNILLSDFGDTTLYRKTGGTYFEGVDLDDLFGAGGVQQTRILIESTAVNGTWVDTYSLSLGGVPVSGTANYTVTGKPASASVTTTAGVVNYNNVIQVRAVYNAVVVGAPATLVRTRESWYAKGRGLIYLKNIDHIFSDTVELRLRRSQIF